MSIPTGIVSHARQVCSLYKRVLRNLEAYSDRRTVFRYRAVMMRQRFEKNRCVNDMAKATELLEEGERELFENRHPLPRTFAMSPGGCAFERDVIPPDWVLDYWDPLEKAQYPEYFAKREQRKKEYMAWWDKQYGKPDPKDMDHH